MSNESFPSAHHDPNEESRRRSDIDLLVAGGVVHEGYGINISPEISKRLSREHELGSAIMIALGDSPDGEDLHAPNKNAPKSVDNNSNEVPGRLVLHSEVLDQLSAGHECDNNTLGLLNALSKVTSSYEDAIRDKFLFSHEPEGSVEVKGTYIGRYQKEVDYQLSVDYTTTPGGIKQTTSFDLRSENPERGAPTVPLEMNGAFSNGLLRTLHVTIKPPIYERILPRTMAEEFISYRNIFMNLGKIYGTDYEIDMDSQFPRIHGTHKYFPDIGFTAEKIEFDFRYDAARNKFSNLGHGKKSISIEEFLEIVRQTLEYIPTSKEV